MLPSPGKHTLVLVDENGEELISHFEILSQGRRSQLGADKPPGITFPGFTGIMDAYTGFLHNQRFFMRLFSIQILSGSNKILTMVNDLSIPSARVSTPGPDKFSIPSPGWPAGCLQDR